MSQTVWRNDTTPIGKEWIFDKQFFDGQTPVATSSGASNPVATHITATHARDAGKYYFEVEYTGYDEFRYTDHCPMFIGIRTPDVFNHLNVLLGSDTTGFAISPWDDNNTSFPTEVLRNTIRTYYNNVEVVHATVATDGSYDSPWGRRRVRVAVDYDAGKVWLGMVRNFTADAKKTNWIESDSGMWAGGGDPASGTTPTYTFTPNTAYAPAFSSHRDSMALLCTKRGALLGVIPSGFLPYDTSDEYDELIRSHSPYLLLLGESWSHYRFPAQTRRMDCSGNLRHVPSAANESEIEQWYIQQYPPTWRGCFASLTTYVSIAYSLFVPFPLSATSITIACLLYVRGAARLSGSNNTWDEGTGLFHNNDVRLSMRGQRLIASAESVAVNMASDLALGGHYVVMRITSTHLALVVDNVEIGTVTLSGATLKKGNWWTMGGFHDLYNSSNYDTLKELAGVNITDLSTATCPLISHFAIYPTSLTNEQIAEQWRIVSFETLHRNKQITPRQSRIDTRNVIQR